MQLITNGVQIDEVYTDIKKAFDTIYFNIIINKLNIIDIRDPS